MNRDTSGGAVHGFEKRGMGIGIADSGPRTRFDIDDEARPILYSPGSLQIRAWSEV